MARELTQAFLVERAADGTAHGTVIDGLSGRVVPSVAPDVPGVDLAAMLRLIPDTEPYPTESSPLLREQDWRDVVAAEDTDRPVTMVIYAGVDHLYGVALVPCDGSDDERVTFTSWKNPTEGELECGTTPPEGSWGELAQEFCP